MTGEPVQVRTPRSWAPWLGATALLVAPSLVISLWVLGSWRTAGPPEAASAPQTVPISETSFDGTARATVTLSWAAGAEVPYGGPAGTVTTVHVGPGSTLALGAPIVDVDGTTVRAIASRTPLYRPVDARSSPAEIEAVNQFLSSVGLRAGPGAQWTTATQDGVRAYARQLGGDPLAPAFEPSWAMWVPTAQFTVAEHVFRLGFPAPAPGEPALTGTASLIGAAVASEAGGDDAARVLVVEDQTFPLEQNAVTGDVLPALAGQLPSGTEEIQAITRSATAFVVVTVPPAAVISDTAGRTCVLSTDEEGRDAVSPARSLTVDGRAFVVTAVEVQGGAPGSTFVTGFPEGAGDVVINPRELDVDVDC